MHFLPREQTWNDDSHKSSIPVLVSKSAKIDLAQESCLKYQQLLREAPKIPEELFMNKGLAGAGFEGIHVQPVLLIVYARPLPTQGRRAVLLDIA